jgi:hypothetical protein
MELLWGIIGAVVGLIIAALFFRGRSPALTAPTPAGGQDLKAVLDEIKELRTEIDILKTNPTLGEAVKAALKHAHDQPDFTPSAYNVAVSPAKLPASAYNVLVRPNPLSGGDVR